MLNEETLNKQTDNEEENSQLIKPINPDVVHRICSGQVVLSLAIAVKELVENSIDAGATRIDIHLQEYGADLLEVSDNGSGVLKKDFEALTLKHYTSKIQEFNDLESITTLGFRGEALSSLCALSDLLIVTKHVTAEFGTKITYDKNGKIIQEDTTARENGTTVTLQKLFSTLPVRRKDFLKNLKREFNKMCQLLYAYCLVSKGIRFSCTNLLSKGSKSTVVATEGHQTVRENIINVFGAKQISTLIDVETVIPDKDIQNEYGVNLQTDDELPFTFEFLISSVTHGCGRSATDRQFYFINSRPCEPSRLIKLVNEIYKSYNSTQYPFVYLNIIAKTSLVDVNVTPDKRQVFLENEKILLAIVRASLVNAFKSFPATYTMQNLDIMKMDTSVNKTVRGIKRSVSEGVVKRGSILEAFRKRSRTEETATSTTSSLQVDKNSAEYARAAKEADDKLRMLIDIACKLTSEDSPENSDTDSSENIDTDLTKANDENDSVSLSVCLDEPLLNESLTKKPKTLNMSISDVQRVLKRRDKDKINDKIKIRFRSQISPENNKLAENELKNHITKNNFKEMDIIGQFNLGFIITKLNNDLFIVDQHATDEKYNFEQLQLSTVIDSQVLVNPQPLELTAGNEELLIENIEVFKKNGFAFKINESAPCTKKIALTAIPVSKNCIFGKDDIIEMLCMLQESSQTMCRPSKIRSMFASRACRKSVMIGKHLSKTDMKNLVDHMGEIDQPWNCPHGRPTMRHLINLDLIENKH